MTRNKLPAEGRSLLPGRPLTPDDIEAAASGLTGDARVDLARALVAAAETPGRLADAVDAPYALSLAAEIHNQADDLDTALDCAEKAVAANERTNGYYDFSRALFAQLLFAAGRDEEALTQLRQLRRRMTRDPDAVAYITDTLVEAGRVETAVHWLTGAVMKLLDRPNIGSQRGAQAYLVAITRRRLRQDLDQPLDEYDEFAERMKARLDSVYEESLRPSRNSPCPCGSGLKYKRCHGRAD